VLMNEWARVDYLWDRGRDARGTRGASARRRAGCDAAIGDGRAGRQATHVGPGDGGRTGHRRRRRVTTGLYSRKKLTSRVSSTEQTTNTAGSPLCLRVPRRYFQFYEALIGARVTFFARSSIRMWSTGRTGN
jgi:hypothetical protein